MSSKVSLQLDLSEVNIASYGGVARMINPWLSDPPGEHLDQPTELYIIVLFIGNPAP